MLNPPEDKINVVTLIYWKGVFVIPDKVRLENDILVDIPPVETVKPELKSLSWKLEHLRFKEINKLSIKEFEKLKINPVLVVPAAIGARNWRELSLKGCSYTVIWKENKTFLYFSKLDDCKRWEYDRKRTQVFPASESMDKIAELILEDVKSLKNPIIKRLNWLFGVK